MQVLSNMEQVEHDLLYGYIREGNFPDNITKNKKDSLRRKSKSFVMKDDGLLYFRDKKKNLDLKVYYTYGVMHVFIYLEILFRLSLNLRRMLFWRDVILIHLEVDTLGGIKPLPK